MLLQRVLFGILVCLPICADASDVPAKSVFGAQSAPSPFPANAFGGYARGCLAGAVQLPMTGPGWQAMRLSRNRNWGHPKAIRFIENLASKVQEIGWPGLLIGDISQPRGGPMRTGHRSHQIGLDIDIWLRPGEARALSRAERERMSSHVVVRRDRKGVNKYWTPRHAEVLRAAARDDAVARIFVNAAIKQALCTSEAASTDRRWLRKIRPWWGHDAHFHVRLNCPAGSTACEPQPPVAPGDGCDDTLAWWFSDEALTPAPRSATTTRKTLLLTDLPDACGRVARD